MVKCGYRIQSTRSCMFFPLADRMKTAFPQQCRRLEIFRNMYEPSGWIVNPNA
jgi:hypothetical protein